MKVTEIYLQIIFFCLFAIPCAQSSEPTYNGKALSEWLGEPDKEVRYEAIQQIGTNGIPTLLDILSAKDGT